MTDSQLVPAAPAEALSRYEGSVDEQVAAWAEQTAVEAAGAADLMRVQQIRATATALAVYLRQGRAAAQAIHQVTQVRLIAERRTGQILKEQSETGQRQSATRPRPNDQAYPPDTLADLGVTRVESSTFQKLAAIPEPIFEEVVAEQVEAGTLSRAAVLRAVDDADPFDETREAGENQRRLNRFFTQASSLADESTWAQEHLALLTTYLPPDLARWVTEAQAESLRGTAAALTALASQIDQTLTLRRIK